MGLQANGMSGGKGHKQADAREGAPGCLPLGGAPLRGGRGCRLMPEGCWSGGVGKSYRLMPYAMSEIQQASLTLTSTWEQSTVMHNQTQGKRSGQAEM